MIKDKCEGLADYFTELMKEIDYCSAIASKEIASTNLKRIKSDINQIEKKIEDARKVFGLDVSSIFSHKIYVFDDYTFVRIMTGIDPYDAHFYLSKVKKIKTPEVHENNNLLIQDLATEGIAYFYGHYTCQDNSFEDCEKELNERLRKCQEDALGASEKIKKDSAGLIAEYGRLQSKYAHCEDLLNKYAQLEADVELAKTYDKERKLLDEMITAESNLKEKSKRGYGRLLQKFIPQINEVMSHDEMRRQLEYRYDRPSNETKFKWIVRELQYQVNSDNFKLWMEKKQWGDVLRE